MKPPLRLIATWTYLLILASPALICADTHGTAASAQPDIAAVQDRYVRSLLPADAGESIRLRDIASKLAGALLPDGRWPDIQYSGSGRANWEAAEHLNRTLVMAKWARLSRNEGRPEPSLNAKVLLALQFWTDHDYQNPNWWWNQIGVPELIGEIATLMQDELPSPVRSKVIDMMERSDWRRARWTGANLTWGVTTEIVRGCIQNDPSVVEEGFERMYQEIRIVGPTEEGVEQDESFHQHGPQLYNGGYGLDYASDIGRFVAFAWQTRFQIPADKMAALSSYLLDGEQWMLWGDIFDYSAIGREITRKSVVAVPHDWTGGPISPAGPAYSLGNVIEILAGEPTPRQREFQQFASRLREEPNAPAFVGNKQFWCSDFMVHRRSGFYTSVKMRSNRTIGGEIVNGEGKKSQYLSDGANFLYLSGNEYKNIFPVWDWTKLPGTTAIQGALNSDELSSSAMRGKSVFAGGVSDGTYGMAAMDLEHGNLTAKKAWFFFDQSYLCLGAGITLSGNAADVATDVNQALLQGIVLTSESKTPLGGDVSPFTARGPAWVYHDHVGYVLSSGSHFDVSAMEQTGRWSEIGSGSDQPVRLPVFNLWIDQGKSPHQGTYQYVVLPGATIKETAGLALRPEIRVLANDDKIQAAWDTHLQVGMIAFREPGRLQTPAGTVATDHACLLLLRHTKDGWKVGAANPVNMALTLHVNIGRHEIAVQLPDGNFAGSTVMTTVPIVPRHE